MYLDRTLAQRIGSAKILSQKLESVIVFASWQHNSQPKFEMFDHFWCVFV